MEERGDALHIADTRKLDDRPEDPLWDWHMGVIIERMPRIMNRQLAPVTHCGAPPSPLGYE